MCVFFLSKERTGEFPGGNARKNNEVYPTRRCARMRWLSYCHLSLVTSASGREQLNRERWKTGSWPTTADSDGGMNLNPSAAPPPFSPAAPTHWNRALACWNTSSSCWWWSGGGGGGAERWQRYAGCDEQKGTQ